MPPKKIITKEIILQKAFKLLRKEGFSAISARRLAKELNTSTMPIYVYFKSMEDLKEELLKMAHRLLLEYQKKNWTGSPFLDTGMGYIKFAKQEKMLFRECFINRQTGTELVEQATSSEIIKIMKQEEYLKDFSDEELSEILFRLWIFTFGFACLVTQGFIKDINEEMIKNILNENGEAIISHYYNLKKSRQN